MRSLLLASLVAALAAGAASAQQPTPEQIFKAWDKNGDGGITLEEWTAAGRKEQGFQFSDTDKDGKVTLDELKAAMAKAAQRQGG